jgi:hypothetical protein
MPVSPCFLADVTPKQLEEYLDRNPKLAGSFYRNLKDNYFSKGLVGDEAVAAMANDLNIPQNHLRRIINRPKTVRPYNAAQATAARQRRDFLRDNEDYVKRLSTPYLARFGRLLRSLPRDSLLFQHGGTASTVHAQPYLTRVDKIHRWLVSMKDSLGAISPKYHDQIRTEIEGDPLYPYMRDVAGLQVGFKDTPTGWKAAFGWNARAWNATLIPLRIGDFKAKMKFWTKGKAEFWTDDLAKAVASEINKSTGTMSPGQGLHLSPEVVLAPKLMQAGWYKALIDPMQIMATYAKMAESKINPNLVVSASERRANHMRALNWAAWTASSAGWLATNQALLKATGQKQNINFGFGPGGDFSKPDLWRYKFGGYVIRPRGGIENLALMARIIAMTTKSRKELHGRTKAQAVQQMVGQYGTYKLNPLISTAFEIGTGETIFGEALPWKRAEKGQTQLSYTEWLSQHGPIFFGGAAHEFYAALREQGMDIHDANSLFRGLTNRKALEAAGITGFSEFFGIGAYKEREPTPKRTGKAASFYSQ